MGSGENHSLPTQRRVMEKLDKERYLKRVIVVCWIALAKCFGIKLFGGNLFEIMCSNENFIKVCNYADNHIWAYYLMGALYCFASLYFFALAICQKLKYEKWELIVVIATVVIGSALKLINQYIGLVFDVWQFIIMPCVFTIKQPKKHWYVIIANVLLLVFQFVSAFTKNVGINIMSTNSALVSSIYSIDVILMVLLYFAYSNCIKVKEKK